MSVTGSARKKRLQAARILCLVFFSLLTAGNILHRHLEKKVLPGPATATAVHSWDEDYVRQHAIGRSQRFPSVDERVKLYMSNWYLPPCRDASIGKFAGKYTIGTTQTNDGNSWPILNVSIPWESVSNKSNMMIDSTVLDNRKILLHRATIEDCGRSEEQYK
jgi:hypothetical protein